MHKFEQLLDSQFPKSDFLYLTKQVKLVQTFLKEKATILVIDKMR